MLNISQQVLLIPSLTSIGLQYTRMTFVILYFVCSVGFHYCFVFLMFFLSVKTQSLITITRICQRMFTFMFILFYVYPFPIYHVVLLTYLKELVSL